MVGYLMMTSRSTFHPSEKVYRYLCEIIYPKQTVKKKLIVENWQKWENMLRHRPRLRTNGFYTLCTIASKAPNNDKFWEEKQYKSVETRYFRHLRFFDDGRVLYSLDVANHKHVTTVMAEGVPIHKRVYEGHYCIIRGREVKVEVQPVFAIRFVLPYTPYTLYICPAPLCLFIFISNFFPPTISLYIYLYIYIYIT